jgi:chemotaxis regulatin CheY-phosphate phosphatase CheZ
MPLALADQEEAQKAEEAILSIMTACGFHDLVGQRVTKITETLDQVIATRLTGERAAKTQTGTRSEIVLEGPGASTDQAQIDALFSKKN